MRAARIAALTLVAACRAPATPTPTTTPPTPPPPIEPAAAAAPPRAERPVARWCLHEAVDQSDQLVIVTANHGYVGFGDKPRHRWLLHVNMTVTAQNPNGHPTRDEAVVLDRVEDGISAALDQAVSVHHVGRATARGARELMYYVDDPAQANAVMTRIGATAPERPWEYRITEDATWAGIERVFVDAGDCDPPAQ